MAAAQRNGVIALSNARDYVRDMRRALFAIAISVFAATAVANPFEYSWQQLAPNVFAGIRQDPFELPQEGNTLFVVTDAGVVVFDAGGSPLMGESIVAKVRSVTKQPITHVVISHWHGDHMRGLQSIRAAFPNVSIISTPFARDLIASSQDKWLKRRVSMVPNIRKAFNAAFEKKVDMSGRPLIAAEEAWLRKGLAITDDLDRENQRTAFVVPNTTFTDRIVLFLGSTEIQLLHPGKAHTAGDVILWLPQEKILATGDIVNGPVPLMPSPYARDYIDVLGRLKALGFATLVPGHGAIERDTAYIDLLVELFESATKQMRASLAKGTAKDAAIASIDLSAIEPKFTHGDPFLKNRFDDYVASTLPNAVYLVETGAGLQESF